MTPVDPASGDGAAYAGEWVLDPARTSITFHTKAMWVLPVKGTAQAREGGGRIEADGTVEGRLVIDAASIDTGMKKRDTHLRSADFFDTDTHPTMEFEVTSVRPGRSGKVALDGTLTIHGQRRPLVLEADVEVDGATATVRGVIDDLDRSDWGIGWTKMGAGLHNKVEVDATLTRR